MRANSLILDRRAALLAGRKPSKKKRSVGSPAIVKAASAAEGPGRLCTATPCATASETSLKPGSEIRGVPASEINASASPSARRAQNSRARLGGVVFVIGDHRRRDLVMIRQAARNSRVFGEDGVRPQRGLSSARNVMSPRLPIGVATMCNPGSIVGDGAWTPSAVKPRCLDARVSLREQTRFAPLHRSKTPRRGSERTPSGVYLIFLIIRGRKCHNLP